MLSRSQLNALFRAAVVGVPVPPPSPPPSGGYWPAMAVGQNVPTDSTYAAMRVFNDRSLAMDSFFVFGSNATTPLPAGSQDANGNPTTAFEIKLCEGGQATDPLAIGTWVVNYTGSAKPTITALYGGWSMTSHTFSGGVGQIVINYTGPATLGLKFSSAVSLTGAFDPTTSADILAGNPVGRYNAQYLRTVTPYSYLRFMDMARIVRTFVNTATTTWPLVTTWGMRATTANAFLNTINGNVFGSPLEWMVDLCNQTGKDGWFCIDPLADDDYVTRYATQIATTLGSTQAAFFELSDEDWNFASSFFTYRKTGIAGMVETKAGQPASCVIASNITSFSSDGTTATVVCLVNHGATNWTTPVFVGLQSGYTGFAATGTLTIVDNKTITYPCSQASTGGTVAGATVLGANGFLGCPVNEYSVRQYGQCVLCLSSDGTTATVRFTQPHGATTGATPVANSLNTGYTGFKPVNGSTLTVIDAYTVSWPCTQTATTNPVPANVALPSAGYIALNGASNLFTNGVIQNVYGMRQFWFHRRQWEIAALVRAAFTAAGRTLTQCKTLLMFQVGTSYTFGTQDVQNFLRAIKGAELNSVFSATSVGGYFDLDLSGSINGGFGLTGGNSTPTDTPSILAQLRTFVDHGYAAYKYSQFVAWAKSAGMEAWCYECGIDTEYATASAAASAANSDPLAEGLVRDWVRTFAALGFTKLGWYQCGAGGQTGAGCFSLGRTAAEIDFTSAPAAQSPKFRGLLAGMQGPGVPVTRHALPCVLSGYDVVGNEAIVTTVGVWPSLSGTNNHTFGGSFGYTMGPIWSETTQTVNVTLKGHTTSTAQTVAVQVLGGDSGTLTAPAISGDVNTAVTFGTCQVAMSPGPNYVQFSSTGAATIFPHEVDFAAA